MSAKQPRLYPAAEVATLSAALAEATRIDMLHLLARSERTIEALARLLDFSSSTTASHMALLQDARLTVSRREGDYVYYSIAGDRVRRLLHAFIEVVEHNKAHRRTRE